MIRRQVVAEKLEGGLIVYTDHNGGEHSGLRQHAALSAGPPQFPLRSVRAHWFSPPRCGFPLPSMWCC